MKEKSSSRSIQRAQKRVAKAVERREDLLDRGKLSLSSGQGVLSIIVSGAPDYKTKMTPEQQYSCFREEAERLSADRAKEHQAVRIIPRAFPMDIKMELANEEVTDITLIGHGSIGDFWVDGRNKHFGWGDISKAASHLKQGVFEQRTCGNFPLSYNVPLGTFAVASLGNLRAAPNIIVPNNNPPENLFRPVFNDVDGLRQQIEALNQQYTGTHPVGADQFEWQPAAI